MALADTVTKVSTGLNALPDVLVRRLNLPESAGRGDPPGGRRHAPQPGARPARSLGG
jgi:hypothetical protein